MSEHNFWAYYVSLVTPNAILCCDGYKQSVLGSITKRIFQGACVDSQGRQTKGKQDAHRPITRDVNDL